MKQDAFPLAMFVETWLEPIMILLKGWDVLIERVYIAHEIIMPLYGTVSERVQSCYTVTLVDLPISGRSVRLTMGVRRFFCQKSTCTRKIFAERFPSLTCLRARFCLRLQDALRHLGLALGGEAGARLRRQLSLPESTDTTLRLVHQSDVEHEWFVSSAFPAAKPLCRWTSLVDSQETFIRAGVQASCEHVCQERGMRVWPRSAFVFLMLTPQWGRTLKKIVRNCSFGFLHNLADSETRRNTL